MQELLKQLNSVVSLAEGLDSIYDTRRKTMVDQIARIDTIIADANKLGVNSEHR